MRHKKKSRLAAAEFLAVLIVTAVVFTKGLSAALAWRGYKAVGGEFMLLLLPIIYYEAKRITETRTRRTNKRSTPIIPPGIAKSSTSTTARVPPLFGGSVLRLRATPIAFLQAATATVLSFSLNKSKAENTTGGITYDTATKRDC